MKTPPVIMYISINHASFQKGLASLSGGLVNVYLRNHLKALNKDQHNVIFFCLARLPVPLLFATYAPRPDKAMWLGSVKVN